MKYQETSRMAYQSVLPYLETQKARVYNYIRKRPSTCEQVEIALHLRHQSASATINHLKNERLIKPRMHEGRRVRRRTTSGRLADVYKVRRVS